MALFKDKAKRVLEHLREVRNKGTCRPVLKSLQDDQGPASSSPNPKMLSIVEQVLNKQGNATKTTSLQPFPDANNNHNSNKSEESLTYVFKKVSLASTPSSELQDDEEEEKPYQVPIEEALSSFNRKWNMKNNRSISGQRKVEGKEVSIKDYHLVKIVGKGAFGKVLLVQSRGTGKFYAMKVLEKRMIISHNNVGGVINEKKILQCISFPFIVQIHAHFKDSLNLYMVMEFVSGGDLFFHLRRMRRFNEQDAQFYSGQIVLAFEYLHAMNVVYRDLKPENIMIGYDGYIKLTDFGLAKRVVSGNRTNSMLGTAEYLAPEIFLQKPYGKQVDWWALGILTYEMVHGRSPFRSETDRDTYHKILSGRVRFAHTTLAYKEIVTQLLKDEPSERLGSDSVDQVKGHSWFENMDWKALLHKKMTPPFVPELNHRGDTKFFDSYNDNIEDLHYDINQEREVRDDVFAAF